MSVEPDTLRDAVNSMNTDCEPTWLGFGEVGDIEGDDEDAVVSLAPPSSGWRTRSGAGDNGTYLAITWERVGT
jgi:hypothetical protein